MFYSEVAVRDGFATRACSGWQRERVTGYGYQEYDSCPKKQESVVRISCEHPTELTCLQELLKRLQDRHDEYAQVVEKVKKLFSMYQM
jgi:hypothetical protein